MMVSNLINAEPEYKYQNSGLQITCPEVDLTPISNDIKKEIEELSPTLKDGQMPILNNVLSSLKKNFSQRRVNFFGLRIYVQ